MTTDILINIDVDDLHRAVDFYTRALALQVGRRLFNGQVVELLGASSSIYLLTKPAGTLPFGRATQARDYSRHWTPLHLDFVVDDLDAAVATALSAGATIEGGLRSLNWGRIAQLSDPFGHGLCLLQWQGKGYDEAID